MFAFIGFFSYRLLTRALSPKIFKFIETLLNTSIKFIWIDGISYKILTSGDVYIFAFFPNSVRKAWYVENIFLDMIWWFKPTWIDDSYKINFLGVFPQLTFLIYYPLTCIFHYCLLFLHSWMIPFFAYLIYIDHIITSRYMYM